MTTFHLVSSSYFSPGIEGGGGGGEGGIGEAGRPALISMGQTPGVNHGEQHQIINGVLLIIISSFLLHVVDLVLMSMMSIICALG